MKGVFRGRCRIFGVLRGSLYGAFRGSRVLEWLHGGVLNGFLMYLRGFQGSFGSSLREVKIFRQESGGLSVHEGGLKSTKGSFVGLKRF